MFPREQRLRKSKDIIQVLRRGVRRSSVQVACSFLKKPGSLTRVTVIVDTKVSKKAVERNLYKRRIRAALKEFSLPGGDLVVRAYPHPKLLIYSQLQPALAQCLKPFLQEK